MFARVFFLTTMAGWLAFSSAPAAAGNPERTRELVAVLQSDAPLFDKARACQQLGEFGTPEAVPALAALLADEHLAAYARSGLEGIADPSAAAALRAATATLRGKLLAGAVNSLGVLRDSDALSALRELAADPNSGVVKEALLALGRIASEESIIVLRQALADRPEAIRPEAAAACLLAAEKQLADGRESTARALYDAVRRAPVPAACRAGAVRGAILARRSDGVPFLVEQLRSEDEVARQAALITVREIPSDSLARALNAELERASPALQVQLLTALVDCHNPQSFPVIRAKAASADPAVRQTALRVLGRIGSSTDAAVLLEALAESRSPDESSLALSGLEQLPGGDVDDRIVEALASAKSADLRLNLVRLVESRGAANGVGELLKQAAAPDAKISVAAFGALKSLAGSPAVPALIALAKACQNDPARNAAESAVASAALRTGTAESTGAAVLAELQAATDPAQKISWVRILTSLGYAQALPTINAALNDPNEAVAADAMTQLGRWPDPAPVEDLLAVIETSPNPAHHRRALASVLRLAATAAEERQRPEATVTAWLQRANRAARSVEDKHLILSVLGRLKNLESFALLTPCLDEPALRAEAGRAVVQIAPALAKSENAAAVKAALVRIAATAENPDLRKQAEAIAGTIPDLAKPASLFDGSSLAGWEGNSDVWRVQDGLIVGGSLQGNPRNEFLATTRSYTNFVLRLEYKLVGTQGFVNGGVQFRSVRVKAPPNEMSGYQADIGAGYSGFLYDESRRNRILARAPEEQVKRLEKPGDWNRYEIRCAGPRIQLLLNGEQTVDYTETEPGLAAGGLIALQIHGACQAEISFRNLTVQELP